MGAVNSTLNQESKGIHKITPYVDYSAYRLVVETFGHST